MGKNIAIIGAGNNGLTMAAHLAFNSYNVTLWNRTEKTVSKLLKSKEIHVSGKINGKAKLWHVTTSIREAIENADFIFITQPAHTHKELATKMAPYIKSGAVIVLNPGRTFGALEIYNTLKENSCKNIPLIAETQTIIYTCRKLSEDSVKLLELKKSTLLSALNYDDNSEFISLLPELLQDFYIPAKSMIETSIGNVGMILHCAPVLLNIGWIENKETKFLYYYSGITKSIALFLEKLDSERVLVSEALGCKVPNTREWLNYSYCVNGKNLFDSLQNVESYKTIDAPPSLEHRYIYEDISTGLVPLEAIGKMLDINMKNCSLVIDLATQILNYDFRKNGRSALKMGINNRFIDNLKNGVKPI